MKGEIGKLFKKFQRNKKRKRMDNTIILNFDYTLIYFYSQLSQISQ